MAYYRLYCINEDGHFFHCEEFEATSDEVAVEMALELRDRHAAELWSRDRLVRTFTQVSAASEG